MGNPLLDIQVTNGEQLLKKYNLNANDAILADEKHLPMCISLLLQYSLA
jgi:adenosine kinase